MQQSGGELFVVLFVFRIESEGTFSFKFLNLIKLKTIPFISTNLLAIFFKPRQTNTWSTLLL